MGDRSRTESGIMVSMRARVLHGTTAPPAQARRELRRARMSRAGLTIALLLRRGFLALLPLRPPWIARRRPALPPRHPQPARPLRRLPARSLRALQRPERAE